MLCRKLCYGVWYYGILFDEPDMIHYNRFLVMSHNGNTLRYSFTT